MIVVTKSTRESTIKGMNQELTIEEIKCPGKMILLTHKKGR
jgi:hypothetical protein